MSRNVRRSSPAAATRPRYSRWRAACLGAVYLLITLHVLHWKLAGRTLAPLELNEVMYTLELGIVTAGFCFMLLVLIATAVFGRFFCSWACHVLALEDLAAWLLGRIGIRPRPIRSRVLRLVPIGAMLYMFVWPQVSRLLAGQPLPTWRLWSDTEGWASFLTTQFARNLPGPGIAALTFLICGFVIVHMLGSRSFCTYACPYGAVFALADRIAPGRIVAVGDCSKCGACTAACQSHIRVHEEAQQFGNIINPSCLKDLDCVAACPGGALQYRFTRPTLFQRIRRAERPRLPYDFSPAEDALMAVAFLAALLVYRGLYDTVPFLMSLAIGAILAWMSVMALRMIRSRDVRLNPHQLKRGGRVQPAGFAFFACVGLVALFTLHSAYVRYHEIRADRAWAALRASPSSQNLDIAIAHLENCNRYGLWKPPLQSGRLASLYAASGEQRGDAGDLDSAAALFRKSLRLRPDTARTHYNLAVVLAHQQRDDEAIAELQRCLTLDPREAEALNNLGFLLWRRGAFDAAEGCLRQAITQQPDLARAHYTLALVLEARGSPDEASREFAAAQRLGLSPSHPPPG